MNSEFEKKVDRIFNFLSTHFREKRAGNTKKPNKILKIINTILSYGFKNYLVISLLFFSLTFILIIFLIFQYQNGSLNIEKNLFIAWLALVFLMAAVIWLSAGGFVYITNDIKNAEKYEESFPKYSKDIKRIISSAQINDARQKELSDKEICNLLILYFKKELQVLELRLKFMDIITYFIAILLLINIVLVIGVPSVKLNQMSDISNTILITSTIIVFLQSFLKAVGRWTGNTLAKNHHESILLLKTMISRP